METQEGGINSRDADGSAISPNMAGTAASADPSGSFSATGSAWPLNPKPPIVNAVSPEPVSAMAAPQGGARTDGSNSQAPTPGSKRSMEAAQPISVSSPPKTRILPCGIPM